MDWSLVEEPEPDPEPWSSSPLPLWTDAQQSQNWIPCCYAKGYSLWIDNKAHQDWPLVDAHPVVEGCGQEHEQQQCEEESRAAHKLEGVETKTAVADLD